ncbi:methyltransferase domain-containing protein [Streptomyces longisporoflavus]|uniref:methyltransferase domain-containing protein n=1 Tax=Streptomyces longisporoflavus TaxID=28044 RepID=UPI00167C5DDC|nr:class I SAM-dependent methyltransferase [Streptomyces longisporoflavus]
MPDSYADLSRYYDLVMTSGYYDYDAYARALLARVGDSTDLLELGVGTGLVCDRLLELSPAQLRITGIDHTAGMLELARGRLGDRARLLHEDVLEMSLSSSLSSSSFDAAYSVGGVWFIIQDQGEAWLSSHLMDEEDNARGLANVAASLKPGGSLLLAVQGPHRPYERALPGGLLYAQDVEVDEEGRGTKDYFIKRQQTLLAHQRLRFRLIPRRRADHLLQRCGFTLRESDEVLWRYVRQ